MITVNIYDGKWIFPQQIKFEDVSDYLSYFENENNKNHIIFDLTHTTTIHSAYIGFLLLAKQFVEKNNGTFELKLSYTAAKIFQMLNILDYLAPHSVDDRKKTA